MSKLSKLILLFAFLPAKTYAAIIDDPTGGPATQASAITSLISRVQNMVSLAAGAIAVAMIVYGAVILAIAGGNEEKIGKGKKILTYAIGGLLFILFARLAIYTFVKTLGGWAS